MTMTQSGLEAAFSQHGDDAWLVFLTISHPSLTDGPLHLVRNNADVSRAGTLFTGLPFDVVLPAQSERRMSLAKIHIPNVDRAITDAVRPLAASNDPVSVSLEVALASAPDVTQNGPWLMVLKNVTWDASKVTAELHPVIEIDQQWPEAVFDIARFPGLYAG